MSKIGEFNSISYFFSYDTYIGILLNLNKNENVI